ncbi:DUF6507 family protein [Arthrobacter sp.]|uniref:DUF6507 family protein n=1 Tax=Arthrobacter sp. TaxID=1667 RepID=UPI00289A6850|nr:DUF6507 family protein [Arthrobacter sp.]
MTSWSIDAASVHAIINRTAARAEDFSDASRDLRNAVEAAQAAGRSAVVGDALIAAYQEYAGLLIANAADYAETACASVRDAVGAYQDADLQMAADAQAGMASTR